MKIRLSELPVGTCFLQGRKKKKKVDDDRIGFFMGGHRARFRKIRGDPEVEQVPCDLRLFGLGLRRHPEVVIEIGHGNILDGRRKGR